ncbi:hypothetical protein ZEAMMB73_Zm00001d008611 [Zea mays]|uniref:Uncharacterized protein n=1 Tax=Zea mays TaxID=4577 RepID=A0A1D6FE71_MAIZE|nr:hypothetical protein ZEAMMB73_Zm00001d008611 [Zea mays]
MSRRSVNPSRRVADGGLPSFGGPFHPKSRSPPVLTIALVVLGVIFLIAYFNSSPGVTVTSKETVTRSEGSCTSEVMRALPYLKKAYGNAMQKVLHVGPDSCTVVSNLLKEGKVEAWGVEPYDLEDTDSTCKRLVRKGFVRNPGQQKAKVSELPKFGRPAKLRSSSWWTRYFVQTGLTENEGPLKKFEEATSQNKYQPDCQIFHLSSPR